MNYYFDNFVKPCLLDRYKIKVVSQPEFIILVDTELAGSASDTMQLPIRGTDMTIDWGDGFVQTGVTQTAIPAAANWITRVYPDGGGVKEIKVTGLDWIRFGNTGDRLKLLEVRNWGTTQWTTMNGSFQGCANMIGTFTDVPDLSNVTNMITMFFGATNFNSDISLWNTANVIQMSSVFAGATNFNTDISGWDVSNVTQMFTMFSSAESFNQDLSGWCVEKIASKPFNFDFNTPAWNKVNRQPIWGTCPA